MDEPRGFLTSSLYRGAWRSSLDRTASAAFDRTPGVFPATRPGPNICRFTNSTGSPRGQGIQFIGVDHSWGPGPGESAPTQVLSTKQDLLLEIVGKASQTSPHSRAGSKHPTVSSRPMPSLLRSLDRWIDTHPTTPVIVLITPGG